MRVAAEVGTRPAACQSGAQRAVEERARQQRQHHNSSSELHRREAVAATVSHAYRAAIEQRERQRRAAAEEQAQQRAQWAAAAPAAGSRHGTNPAGRGRSPFSSTMPGSSSTMTGARGSSPITRAANGSGFDTSQGRDAHFWMLYALHYRRLYGVSTPADADDCWGRMAAAAAAAAADGGSPEDAAFAAAAADGASAHSSSNGRQPYSNVGAEAQQQGGGSGAADDREHSWACEAASSAYAYWRGFARQAAAGFGFAGSSEGAGTGGEDASQVQQQYQQQNQQQQYQQQQYQQQQNQQYQYQHQQSPRYSPMQPLVFVVPAGASVEQQVRAELAALLAASGGDLARFVSALGIPFERGHDSLHTLKNARRAAMLSLHPDRLLQQGERRQAWGHHATTLVNELWRASVGS